MSKKKDERKTRRRRGKKRTRPKRRRKKSPESTSIPEQPDFPDRRAMERSMADIGRLLAGQEFDSIDEANAFLEEMMASGGVPKLSARTALEEAQDLMYDAWEAPSRRERIRLAREALEISPDCADAYVLLAEELARNPREALVYYKKGVEAGERALGEAFFEENAARFWGLLETRPYMRARVGLAQMLWLEGKHEAALEHYRELLRLNPGDNQGNRYLLLACLIDLGRDEEAKDLLAEHPDDAMADWLYSWALVAYRRTGNSAEARRRLKEALDQNSHVPDYMLGRKELPRSLPPYVSWGGEDEAMVYVARFFEGWRRTPGALDWLAKQAR